jgi:hypothetical protein
MSALDEVNELIDGNGWERELVAERVDGSGGPAAPGAPSFVRVRRRSSAVPPADGDVVNLYPEDALSHEQVMQECLRFLRTGRIGA